MEQTYPLTVNGLSFPAVFDTEDVEGVFLPLLEHWTRLQRELGRRTVVFMAAPPGTGKAPSPCFWRPSPIPHPAPPPFRPWAWTGSTIPRPT